MQLTSTKVAAVALVALTACGGGGGSSGLAVSLKATSGTPTAAGVVVAPGVTVTRVRMAVRRISVEGGDASPCAPAVVTTTAGPATALAGAGATGWSPDPWIASSTAATRPDEDPEGDDDDGCRLAFGPFDVDLAGSALSGGVAYAFSAPIPAGTYHEVAVSVNTVPASRAGSNAVLQELAAAHASILVDGFVEAPGTTTGHPFTFSAPLQVEQEREGPLAIGPSSNVTLSFDPGRWFAAPGGGALDPTDPANQGAILDQIRASIRLVHDDDRDGVDDDAEHRPSHD